MTKELLFLMASKKVACGAGVGARHRSSAVRHEADVTQIPVLGVPLRLLVVPEL